MPEWRLSRGDFAVTGAPVVVQELSRSISRSTIVLLLGAVLVMALTLLLVFRARLRLLPLLVALCAAALTFGAMSLVGAPLTMASIAVIPVLIGLAVDYAIQLQSRLQERDEPLPDAVARVRGRRSPDGRDRRERDGRGIPRPRASRPCRWSAASGSCSWSGSGSRCCAR